MGAKENMAAKRKAAAEKKAALAAQKAEAADAPAEIEQEADAKPETFKEAKGLPANVHAKKLAQEKSKKEKAKSAFPIYYSQKGLKVLKFIVKPGKTISVYIGNMSPKKHKVALQSMIAKWKADGVWVEEHAAKALFSKIQDEYVAAAAAKNK